MDRKQAKPLSNKQYDKAYDELAYFLLTQYNRKKRIDFINEQIKIVGQVDKNVS